MRVIELESFELDRSGDLEAGKYEWYLQQLHLATGFFEYEITEDCWKITPEIRSLLSEVAQKKAAVGSLFENDSLDSIVMNFIEGKKVQLMRELLVRHKDRPWNKYLVCGERLVDSTGHPKVRGMVLDISNKGSNSAVDSQIHKLQSLGQLTSGVSHDFNNQLNGILGYVSLMKNSLLDAKMLQYLEGIERSVAHATSLTRQLLTFSHKAVEEHGNVDIAQTLKDTYQMLKHTIDRRIDLKLNMEDKDFNVIGEASLINNALMNLCLNARDAITGQGEISISLKQGFVKNLEGNVLNTPLMSGNYAIIEVRDNGAGMDDAVKKKILTPFFTTKGLGKGTGMGLPLVLEAIQKHKGALTIDSTVGAGSAFTLYLPLIRGFEYNNNNNNNNNNEGILHHSGRILLIDDEQSNLEITAALLDGYGYSVTAFVDPKEAVDYFAAHANDYDCILLDVIMPGMSGMEVFKEVKRIKPDTRIVLLTGVGNPFDLDFTLRQGGDAYLSKPIDHTDLSQTLFEVINNDTLPPKPVNAQKLIDIAPTFDVARSLERIAGNASLYLKIARSFRKEYYGIVDQFPQLIHSDCVEAVRKVHTIKGLAAQVGAEELATYAKELEASLNSGESSQELQGIFLEEFIEVADELLRMEKAV